MQVTPLVIDGVMYVTAGANLFALEPETAKVLWKFSNTDMSRRGLAYWPGDAQTGPRFYTGAGDGRMIAVDVKTGTLATDFGTGGVVDLEGERERRRRARGRSGFRHRRRSTGTS